MRRALRTDPMTLPAAATRLVGGALRPTASTPAVAPALTAAPVQAVLNVVDPSQGWIFEHGAIEVDATVHWELDGPRVVRTTALRWCEYAVYVVVDDPRFVGVGVWLHASDVTEVG